jgi:mannitol-specific phosphotransferase system IIBC component
MLASFLAVIIAYLAFGLLVCLLLRRGWPEDWGEALLASMLGPPLLAVLVAATAAGFLLGRNRPADLGSHTDRKRLTDHRLA